MQASVENIINAPVDPAWIGVAAELVATFPKDASPRDRLCLLFNGLDRLRRRAQPHLRSRLHEPGHAAR